MVTVDLDSTLTDLSIDTPVRISGISTSGYNGIFVVSEVVSNTQSSASSNTYGYSNTNAYASTSSGSYAYGNAYTNSNSSTNFSGRSTTTTTDGGARYAAQQNEDMKYETNSHEKNAFTIRD